MKQRQFKIYNRVLDIASQTPLSIVENLRGTVKDLFFYESVVSNEVNGRYSIIAFGSNIKYVLSGNGIMKRFDNNELTNESTFLSFTDINQILTSSVVSPSGFPSFVGSFFCYLTYDMVKYTDCKAILNNVDIIDIPNAFFNLPEVVIFFDKHNKTINIAVISEQSTTVEDVEARLDCLLAIFSVNKSQKKNSLSEVSNPTLHHHTTKDEYIKMVNTCIQNIKVGEAFQIVPSMRISSHIGKNFDRLSYNKNLCQINPSPFMFFIEVEDFAIIGASPEIMVRVADGIVTIKPLAGTRKRTGNHNIDKHTEFELLHDPKELAEHRILLDLGRNDVGRVCEIGTVSVVKQMEVEYYSHVMHISSTVCGKLDKTKTVVDALMAGFPAGTVSGGPKIKAMEIISNIENTNRSFYAGCVGYISQSALEVCISLRTSLVKNETIYFQAGAGVVADSKPDLEYQECLNKMGALIEALKRTLNQ